MATGESKMSNWDVVSDIKDGDTVPILRNGKNYMSEGLAELNADLTYLEGYVVPTSEKRSSCDDWTDVGVYYLTSNTVPDDIPVGTNGWLIVLVGSTGTKQIWMRMGTPGSNDYMTYIRSYNNSSATWGNWHAVASIAAGTAVGSSTTPVYVNANGRITTCDDLTYLSNIKSNQFITYSIFLEWAMGFTSSEVMVFSVNGADMMTNLTNGEITSNVNSIGLAAKTSQGNLDYYLFVGNGRGIYYGRIDTDGALTVCGKFAGTSILSALSNVENAED